MLDVCRSVLLPVQAFGKLGHPRVPRTCCVSACVAPPRWTLLVNLLPHRHRSTSIYPPLLSNRRPRR